MLAIVARIVLCLSLLAVSGWLSAEVRYPQNPFPTERAIFLSHDGIARLDRRSGEPIWQALPGEQTFEPVVTAERVLAGTSAGLVALAPGDGELLWRRLGDTSVFSPTVVDDLAFVAGHDGRLRALDLASGELRWTRRFSGWIYPPALQNGLLITGGQAATLWALDPTSGVTIWQRPLSQELVYRPVAGTRWVFVTTFAGELLAIDPADGRVRWRHHDPVVSSSPVVADGFVYLGRFDGVLQVFDEETGVRRHRRVLGRAPLLPVGIGDGRVVVADRTPRVTVLTIPDFRVAWQAALNQVPLVSPWFEDDRVAVVGPGLRRGTLAAPDADPQ